MSKPDESHARRVVVSIVQPDPNYRPSNSDADVKSLVRRLVAIEDKIEAENKLKAFVFAEARCNGIDMAALKATVRVFRSFHYSDAKDLAGLSETVKSYLDLAIPKVSTAHQQNNQED